MILDQIRSVNGLSSSSLQSKFNIKIKVNIKIKFKK